MKLQYLAQFQVEWMGLAPDYAITQRKYIHAP